MKAALPYSIIFFLQDSFWLCVICYDNVPLALHFSCRFSVTILNGMPKRHSFAVTEPFATLELLDLVILLNFHAVSFIVLLVLTEVQVALLPLYEKFADMEKDHKALPLELRYVTVFFPDFVFAVARVEIPVSFVETVISVTMEFPFPNCVVVLDTRASVFNCAAEAWTEVAGARSNTNAARLSIVKIFFINNPPYDGVSILYSTVAG